MSIMDASSDPVVQPKATSQHRRTLSVVVEAVVVLTALIVGLLLFRDLGKGALPVREVFPTYYAAIAVVLGYLAIRIATAVLERAVEPKLGATGTHSIKNLLVIVGAIVVGVVVSGLFGFNITSVLIGAGFAGIVLGLAAQQVLGNVFAGILLIISRPFEIGDRVTLVNSSYGLMGSSYAHESELNGLTGVVEDLGIFLTHITLDEGTPAVFPNSSIISSLIVNHSRVVWRTVRVRMDLPQDLPFEAFRSRMMDVLRRHEDTIDTKRSQIEAIDISSTTYSVVIQVWARTRFEEPIKSLIIQEAMNVLRDLSPQSHPPTS